MSRLFCIAILVLGLAACQSGALRDSGGTPMSIDSVEGQTLGDALIWLPAPMVRDARLYELNLRDNEHPIETVTFDRLDGYYNAQILKGFYSLFSKQTVLSIYDEDAFVDWAVGGRIKETHLADRQKFGSSYTNYGGWFAEFPYGKLHCVVARTGAGFGPRASAGAGHGMPFNVVIRVRYCGSETDAGLVRDFLMRPKRVQDREAFRTFVAEQRES